MAEGWPTSVTVVEVGPRDGLQNESVVVPTETKVEFVRRLVAAGLPVVELTSFVRPEWVPQLADAADMMAAITPTPGVRHPVLVPNVRGLDRALECGVEEIAIFASSSEAFSRRNLNRSITDSIEMFRPVVTRALDAGLRVRGYVSTVMGCPYQGDVPLDDVRRVTHDVMDLGVHEVSLGDTIGVGTVGEVQDLIAALVDVVPVDRLAVHMHDTYGQGLANTLAAIEAGITVADTSAGGLGGCPYAPGARGNLATEDLVYALHRSGVDTGVDLDALVATTVWFHEFLDRPAPSRVVQALVARRERES